ncbi:MAG: hydrogenase nickel incorporation protein HypB [Methylococcales bacterium]|jgi:hydrogenase nickel incorporation protein HypB|nr:hydrogenase nickel incorporation protein HypB [Methylococcales bacterium]MBT7445112.1 hydrogenase nickel incorporation protein HypB [Methylococcales bacterium]
MCDTCGCNVTSGNQHLVQPGGALSHTSDGSVAIEVLTNLLSENDKIAAHNRQHFDAQGVLVMNLMSSPGSGKTALLEVMAQQLKGRLKIAVIEGDLETENDAQRIRQQGVQAIQIVTGTACHLDAHMVHTELHKMDLKDIDVVFIENVGNLVCPASFDLGHHINVALLSVTEGDDKPEKYPVMFRAADQVVISKTDLLPYLEDFSPDKAILHIRELANDAPVLQVSVKNAESVEAWIDWVISEVAMQKQRLLDGVDIKTKTQSDGVLLHEHG